ncbi:MAG: hypothetical protein FOGNACKC_00890 [Anaerolineae bacterium]|nr:hypothetical protein [Anaerolineae bacterium]
MSVEKLVIESIKRQTVMDTNRFGFCPLCGAQRSQSFQDVEGGYEPVCVNCFLRLYAEYTIGGVAPIRDRQGAFISETDIVLVTSHTHIQIGMVMLLENVWKVKVLWRYGGTQDGAMHELRAWHAPQYPLYITFGDILVIKVLEARHGQEFERILPLAYPPPAGSDKPQVDGQMGLYDLLGM